MPMKVKEVFALPLGVVTTKVEAPGFPAGELTVREVADELVTVAEFPPIVTVAPERLVPVMVIEVPPLVGPESGEIDVIVGAPR
jgi:hypothetical protein